MPTTRIDNGECATGDASLDYSGLADTSTRFIGEERVGQERFRVPTLELLCQGSKGRANNPNPDGTLETAAKNFDGSLMESDSEDVRNVLPVDLDTNSTNLGHAMARRSNDFPRCLIEKKKGPLEFSPESSRTRINVQDVVNNTPPTGLAEEPTK